MGGVWHDPAIVVDLSSLVLQQIENGFVENAGSFLLDGDEE